MVKDYETVKEKEFNEIVLLIDNFNNIYRENGVTDFLNIEKIYAVQKQTRSFAEVQFKDGGNVTIGFNRATNMMTSILSKDDEEDKKKSIYEITTKFLMVIIFILMGIIFKRNQNEKIFHIMIIKNSIRYILEKSSLSEEDIKMLNEFMDKYFEKQSDIRIQKEKDDIGAMELYKLIPILKDEKYNGYLKMFTDNDVATFVSNVGQNPYALISIINKNIDERVILPEDYKYAIEYLYNLYIIDLQLSGYSNMALQSIKSYLSTAIIEQLLPYVNVDKNIHTEFPWDIMIKRNIVDYAIMCCPKAIFFRNKVESNDTFITFNYYFYKNPQHLLNAISSIDKESLFAYSKELVDLLVEFPEYCSIILMAILKRKDMTINDICKMDIPDEIKNMANLANTMI